MATETTPKIAIKFEAKRKCRPVNDFLPSHMKKHVNSQERVKFVDRNRPYPFAARAFCFGGHATATKEKK